MMYLERPLGRRVQHGPLFEHWPLAIRDTGVIQIILQAACMAQQLVRIYECGLHHQEVGRTREIVGGRSTGRFGWRAEPDPDRMSGIHRDASGCDGCAELPKP